MTTIVPDPPAPSGYRPDIDGLRALAILPVVFYHFRIPGFGGGFVGVDVFFVISGYLITQVLTAADRPISLATFYARRVRRLAPALAVMVLATTIAALILMQPRGLVPYGESLLSLAGGASNLYFWKSLATYFAATAETRPLLHTWSLAVEEQFYLLYPVFLIVAGKLGPRWRLAAVAAAGVTSLALAVWLAPRAPSSSFYLAHTRAWELLAGAVLALRPARALSPRLAGIAGVFGLGLIVFAVTSFDQSSQVPGLAALAPVVGAALLILAGESQPSNPASRLLSLPPLVGIGLISYALYLWHWPINVFIRHYILAGSIGPALTTAAIASAFVLAYLSWRFVERPIRRGALLGATVRALVTAALLSLALAATGIWLVRSDGLPKRRPALAAMALPPSEQTWDVGVFPGLRSTPTPRPPMGSGWLVRRTERGARKVLVWGDSFAGHLAPGFRRLSAMTPFSVYGDVEEQCPPVIDFNPLSAPDCHPHNLEAFARVHAGGFDTVILSAYWQSYLPTGKLRIAQIRDTVERLRKMGLSVLVVGQTPVFPFEFPDEYHEQQMRSGATRDEGWAISTADPDLNTELAAALAPAFFDPTPVFCRAGGCAYLTGGDYMVRDTGHLTAAGSTRLVAALLQTPQLRGAGGTSAEVSRP